MTLPDRTAGIIIKENTKDEAMQRNAKAFLIRREILPINGTRNVPSIGIKIAAKSIFVACIFFSYFIYPISALLKEFLIIIFRDWLGTIPSRTLKILFAEVLDNIKWLSGGPSMAMQ
jgi:hypothetical protein